MKETDFLNGNDRVLSDIRKFNIFEPFQEEELRHLLTMSKLRQYTSGETVFQQGSTDTWLYFLVYGKIRLVKDGKPVALLETRGEVFGEMGAIDCAPRSATAVTDGDTVCLATDIYYIEQLSGNDKLAFGYVIYRVFASVLAGRLRATTSALLGLQGRSIQIW